MVGTANIHLTHHPAKDGMRTRIIHISDERGTDARIEVDPQANLVELVRMQIDLADFDWAGAKQFKKVAYDEKYELDVAEHGPSVTARFYLGAPDTLIKKMDAVIQSDDPGMILLYPGAFKTPPGGHKMSFHRLVFDDEADETVGCLILMCEKPERDPASEKPWTLDQLRWIAYGLEGEVAEGTTDD
jgi:hypothetical protein